MEVKDSCGVISQRTVGQDLKVKMIFQDGTQEIILARESNGTFRFVLDGMQKAYVFLSSGKFMQAGYNYMNAVETSKPHFDQACGH